MKTLKVAVFSTVAIILSGCATGYYQRGYSGYGNGYYSSPAYSRSYGSSSYYSPGTSITYGRYYLPQGRIHDHHDHHDWRRPNFDRHDDRRGDWRGRAPDHDRDDHQSDRSAWRGYSLMARPEPAEAGGRRDWRERGGDGDGRRSGGWRGRRDQ
ncbi:hypothetical protein NP603_01030 [Methylomonas sp. SURF-1]|uniref:Lipoprotein n=1 Tax=Methylomonas aurea TaxID=2952224 RepID=A0ABT1UBS2_9GAMM|nr:hypothetical protein [Methylomonas sp. SURF-1]MCQ8179678.1 hypothetical protein [Methylomonas sp. SURF-1]